MRQELVDCETLARVDAEQMRDEVLGRIGDVVPPWAQEGVVALSHLLREDRDRLIVERRKTTQQRVEHTAQSPHVDGLGVPFILDDFGCGVSDGSTRCHCAFFPDDLAQTKVGNLDFANATASDSWHHLTFVFFLFIVGPCLVDLGRDDVDRFEQKILRLDVTDEVKGGCPFGQYGQRLSECDGILTDERHLAPHASNGYRLRLEG